MERMSRAVMFENIGHETAVPPPQPVEIALGDLITRNIAFPFETEDGRLERT